MPRLSLRSNPLIYPNRPAKIDFSHPAADTVLRFAGVANGSNFRNLLSGVKATVNGTMTAVTDGWIGPAANSADATANWLNFTGNPAVQDTSQTVAMICVPKVIGFYCASSTDATNGMMIASFGSNWWLGPGAGLVNDTTIPITLNAPTFVAVSVNASTCNFVVANLATGKVQTSVTGGINQGGAGNGTYTICGDGQSDGGSIAVAAWMFSSGRVMSISALRAWAASPWDLWYARSSDFRVGAAIAAGFIPYSPWPQAAPILGT